MIAFFADHLRQLGGTPGYAAQRLCMRVDINSFSEAEDFFLDIRRQSVLRQGASSLRSVIDDRVRAWQTRMGDMSHDARASDTSAS
jgi:hypothetical protein